MLGNMQIEFLRDEFYNATITDFRRVHDKLAVIRVRPDKSPPQCVAGQYVALGLGYWEERILEVQEEAELSEAILTKLAMRAYSVSCRLVDDEGRIVTLEDDAEFEFYITLVTHGEHHAPVLTPRLFKKDAGDRIFMASKCRGNYTLRHLRPTDRVVFLATGTGEAPHNAMIAKLLAGDHGKDVASIVCCRHRADLGYEVVHRQLDERLPHYSYRTLTTREPENRDTTVEGYVGVRYVQDYFESGDMERDIGFELQPEETHIYLCGNPQMIGPPQPGHGLKRQPLSRPGMLELLEARGFVADQPRQPGNLHYESYW